MRAVDLIRKKRDGEVLRRHEIEWFVRAHVRGEVTDYQAAALLMAVYFRGMSGPEVVYLTRAFMESGATLNLDHIPGPKVDKHSTGGVGDKVSLILAPLVACAGVKVPMVSGRGLGFTGGTLDKLETIPGYNVNLPLARFAQIVERVGCSIIGQTKQMCPADKKWYALRDVTATVDSIPLIVASIMSKKLSEGIDALVLDVKVGTGAFMRTLEEAEDLAHALVRVGQEMGKPVRALLTDMNQPLGVEIGNANEVAESVAVLRNEGDERLTELCVILGAQMMAAGGLAKNLKRAETRLRKLLADGSALAKFREMVEAHGGDAGVIDDPTRLPRSALAADFVSPVGGYLSAMRAAKIGWAAMSLGAGRERAEDAIDPGAGVTMRKRIGDYVERGEPLCVCRAATRDKLEAGLRRLTGVFTMEAEPPAPTPLVGKVVDETS
jgi:pyrimidine-nucleoside phosphorylase/thymidine phosphorylase